MQKEKLFKVLPFILLGVYYFIQSTFDLAFNYSMIMLSVIIVISLWSFVQTMKDKEPAVRRSKTIMLVVFSVMTVGVSSYYYFLG
jgi:uncharacterized membrane protein